MTTKNGPPTLATPQKITPRDSAPTKAPLQSTPAKGVQKVDDKTNEATARNLQANIQKQRTISTTQGPKAIEPKVTGDGKDGKIVSQKPPPIEPVRPILLKQILSDEGMNLVFQQFAEANKFENDVSNIKFYSLVERFKKLPRGDVQLQKARALYDVYIKPGAKMQISVPIPADHLQTIEKQINSKVSRSLFDRIQELISFQVEPIMEKLREDTVAYKNCELEGILLNPTRSLLFLRFAKDMYCEENVMFYLDIYRLEKNLKHARSLPAVVGDEYKDQNTLLCENILQKYILNRAEYQLDIPETTRSQILKEMKQLRKTGQVTKTLFEQARLRVLEKMRWDMLEPFIKAEQESLDGSDEEEDDEDDDLDELGPSHLELPSPAIPSSTPSSHMSGFFERSASADQLTLSDKMRKHGGSTSISINGDPTSPTLPAKDIIRPMNPLAKTPTKDSIHFPVPLSPLTPTLESQTPQKVPKSNSFDRKGLSLTPWLIDRRRSVSAADLYSVKQIIARGRKLSADLDPSGGSPLSASSGGGSVVPSPISSSTPRSLNDWNHGFFSSIRIKPGGLAQPGLTRFNSSPEPSTTRFLRSNSKDGVSAIRGGSDESPVGTPPTDYAGSTPKLAPRNLMQRLEITPEDSGSGSRIFPVRSVGLAALQEEDEEIAFTTPSTDTNSPPIDSTENNFPDQKISPIVQPVSSPMPISSTDSASSSTPTSSSASLLSSLPRLELDLEFDRTLPSSLQSSDSADSVGSDAYRFQALQREREEYQQIAYQLVIMDRSCRGLAIRPRFLHSVDDLELDHLKKMGVVPDFKTSKYNILAGLRRRSVKISPLLSGQSTNNQVTKEGWLEDPPGLRRSSSGNSTSSNGSNGSFSGISAGSSSGSEVKGGLTITKTLYGSSSSPLSTPRIKGGKKSKSGMKSPGRQTPLSSPLNRKGPRVHFAFDDGVASPKPKPIILAPQPEVDEEGLPLPSNPISLTASSPTNQDSPELHTHPSDLDFSGSGNGMNSDKNERTPQRKSALKRRSDMLLPVSNGVGTTVAPTHFFPPTTTSTLSASMEAHRGSKIGHARPVTTREGDGVRVRQETFEELIKRVFAEREQESTRLLKVLSEGALLTKFSPMGKGSQRWFAVSKDGTEMLWSKVDKKKGTKRSSLFNRPKKRYLAEVMRIRYGSRWSRRFFRYNHKGRPPWLCFTVVLPDRTLDIVCENEQQVTTWFLGLQSLAPLSQCYLSVGALLWCRARMKVKYRARNQRLKETQVLDQLLAEARAAVRKEKEGLSPVGTTTSGTPSTTLSDSTPGLPSVPTPRISPRASSSSFFPITRPPSTSNSITSSSSSSSSSSVTPSLTVPSPLPTPSSSTTPLNLPATGASPTTPARRSFLSFAFHSNHSTSSSSSSTSPPTVTPSSTSTSSSSTSTSQLPTPRSLLMVT